MWVMLGAVIVVVGVWLGIRRGLEEVRRSRVADHAGTLMLLLSRAIGEYERLQASAESADAVWPEVRATLKTLGREAEVASTTLMSALEPDLAQVASDTAVRLKKSASRKNAPTARTQANAVGILEGWFDRCRLATLVDARDRKREGWAGRVDAWRSRFVHPAPVVVLRRLRAAFADTRIGPLLEVVPADGPGPSESSDGARIPGLFRRLGPTARRERRAA